ncbi:right-handed parallel beta-helix repeat-containing protein [Streptomyces sp. DvalAA-19]|uniref:right-handed parallel beta-helix repeat-containing protein n=1 Tax=Streptomyces sp. DvalAA-19 TaxID=1839761 RepID=UPI00081B9203|nr:right-handed parallel beta-helix repeat-containing protein [Streptomyces sp. DvalAA-19]SCD73950.1 Right handed beta helix region [Streptomyces sp. DvalAA-19]
MTGISRRGLLRGGVVAGAATVLGGVASGAPVHAAGINPTVAGEAAHVRALRKALDDAAAGIVGPHGTDGKGRIIVKAGYAGVPTYTLLNTLVIGGNTALDATGARFVAKFGTVMRKYTLDRTNQHSPTPEYVTDAQGAFSAPAVSGAKAATMLINHVPGSATTGYSAPGNIMVKGGEWDPVSAWVWEDSGPARARADKAPPMNVLTFIHTQDVEIEGVTVWNVKWWHAVELNAVRRGAVRDCFFKGWVENPTWGLWQGEAVQLDLPLSGNTWAGASDGTPTVDVQVQRNYAGASGSQPSWAKLVGSHTGGQKVGQVHARVLIEGNVVDNAKWDAIGAMNTTSVVIRDNTINNSVGGIYVSSMSARVGGQPPVQVGPNPVSGVDIVDNRVTVTAGASGALRNAVRVSADTVGHVSPVSDVRVTGNQVSGGTFYYTPNVTFRPGTTPQQ